MTDEPTGLTAKINATQAEAYLEGDVTELDGLDEVLEKVLASMKESGAAETTITVTVTNDLDLETEDEDDNEKDQD